MKKIFQSFHIYAFFTSVMWSLAYVLTRIASRYVSPLHLSFLRALTATIVLVIIILTRKMPLPKVKDLPWFLLSGLCGIFGYMIFFNKGCSLVTTATGNVMLAMCPPIVAVVGLFLFKEKLRLIQWISIVICFIGVVALMLVSGGFSVNIGLLWLSIAVLCMTAYNLLQRYLSRTYPTLTITATSFVFGTIGLTIFAPPAVRSLPGLPVKAYICILLLGIFCSALGYWSWSTAFSKAQNASSVSNYMFINPFISTIFGLIFIGDPIGPEALIGGSIIMIGLALFTFGPSFLDKRKKS